jgi:hypothetical protein
MMRALMAQPMARVARSVERGSATMQTRVKPNTLARRTLWMVDGNAAKAVWATGREQRSWAHFRLGTTRSPPDSARSPTAVMD